MFGGARVFNQDIGSWNVSSVADMRVTCSTVAYAFNQDLESWCVSRFSSKPHGHRYSRILLDPVPPRMGKVCTLSALLVRMVRMSRLRVRVVRGRVLFELFKLCATVRRMRQHHVQCQNGEPCVYELYAYATYDMVRMRRQHVLPEFEPCVYKLF